MSASEFPIPSVLELFRGSDYPTLVDGSEELQLLADLGFEPDDAGREGFDGLIAHVLRSIGPTLLLLNLSGYAVSRVVLASRDGDRAAAITLGSDGAVTALAKSDLSAPVTAGLDTSSAVVALEVDPHSVNPVPLSLLTEGWLVVAVDAAQWGDVPSELATPLGVARDAVLADIESSISETSLEELLAATNVDSGRIPLYDPTSWSIDGEEAAAAAARDADAEALLQLANAMRDRIGAAGVQAFLAEDIGQDEAQSIKERLSADRRERQLLRRGLKGARRRAQAGGVDGLRRNFRSGQARGFTYTELLIGCHVQGVVDVLAGLAQAATLQVLAKDEEDAPIEGAEVVLQSGEGATVHEASTGTDGTTQLEGLRPGRYTVHLKKAGFAPTSTEVTLASASSVSVELVLPPLAPSLILDPGDQLTRGSTLIAKVALDPASGETLDITGWSYVTPGHGTVARPTTDADFDSEWRGTMALSGEIVLTYKITLPDSGTGASETLRQPIAVEDRVGVTWESVVTEVAEAEYLGQPSPPETFRQLGHHDYIYEPDTLVATSISDGPNSGFVYVESLTQVTFRSEPKIHPDLLDPSSAFFTFHQSASFSGHSLMQASDILAGTRSHEYTHAQHSHRANLWAMVRAMDPARRIESTVLSAPASERDFVDLIDGWIDEIDKPDHELVDEAASKAQARFVSIPGQVMAGINTDPATGSSLGTIWDITRNQPMPPG